MTKAMAASKSELRSLEKRVTTTGRPVLIDSPGSPRKKPFDSGMYSTGPPSAVIQPEVVSCQTLRPPPSTHFTARFLLLTPQK